MDNLQLLSLGAFVLVAMRFVALVFGKNWDGAFKTLASWAVGIAAVVVYAHTGQADTIHVGDVPLALLNGWDQVVLGIGVGSVAGAAWIGVKAFDHTQSAAQPTIVKPGGSASPDA